MPPETTNNDRRQIRNFDQITNLHTSVPDKIPCPRCQSTTTKFCYYNNYNMSQPRYFCKSCRRYWTQGGTLRNIPVGGGNRKNTKRSRTSSPSSSCSSITTTHDPKFQPVPVSISSSGNTLFKSNVVNSMITGNNADVQNCDADNGLGGFSALLHSRGPGFLALAGYGYGNPVEAGFDEMGYGLNINRGIDAGGGVGFWAFPDAGNGCGGGNTPVISSRRNNIYPAVGGGVNVVGGGSWADVDCYGWPDLSITMPGNGLKDYKF